MTYRINICFFGLGRYDCIIFFYLFFPDKSHKTVDLKENGDRSTDWARKSTDRRICVGSPIQTIHSQPHNIHMNGKTFRYLKLYLPTSEAPFAISVITTHDIKHNFILIGHAKKYSKI